MTSNNSWYVDYQEEGEKNWDSLITMRHMDDIYLKKMKRCHKEVSIHKTLVIHVTELSTGIKLRAGSIKALGF